MALRKKVLVVVYIFSAIFFLNTFLFGADKTELSIL
jgi:hypothetical protein